jgi:hypothetical protein
VVDLIGCKLIFHPPSAFFKPTATTATNKKAKTNRFFHIESAKLRNLQSGDGAETKNLLNFSLISRLFCFLFFFFSYDLSLKTSSYSSRRDRISLRAYVLPLFTALLCFFFIGPYPRA